MLAMERGNRSLRRQPIWGDSISSRKRAVSCDHVCIGGEESDALGRSIQCMVCRRILEI
jgi:hypothetical protein